VPDAEELYRLAERVSHEMPTTMAELERLLFVDPARVEGPSSPALDPAPLNTGLLDTGLLNTGLLDTGLLGQLGPAECFYVALVAFGRQDFATACTLAERASRLAPGDAVYAAGSFYLNHVRERGKPSVYVLPEAFSAFIRAGSNQRLYRQTSQILAAAYAEYPAASVLDIGVGDGLALLPALNGRVGHVIAVEPSRQMLERAAEGLSKRQVRFEAVAMTIQEYMERTLALDCDVAQATFSLQNLPRAERMRVWPWLRAHARRVLVVEFDVPDFAHPYSASRVAHVVERYRRGVAEHASDPLVVQGFLMPVMFGYFDPTAARTNYEQPRSDWIDELRAGGFTSIRSEPLDEYWWAPAVLFDAR
jgi:hypothetical protein